MSLSNTILISKSRASNLGLGLLFMSSTSLIIYTFSKKSKKIKKVKILLFKNKEHLYKFLVILAVFFPNFLSSSFLFSRKKFSDFFELFNILCLKLINFNFFYLLGLLFFQIFWVPFFKISFLFFNIFLNFLNFLSKIKIFNSFLFLDTAFQLYIFYWSTLGFFAGFFNDISLFSKVKILLLDFLAFLTSTLLLIVTLLFNKEEIQFRKFSFLNKNFDFFSYLEKLKKNIYNFFLMKWFEFNQIENFSLKFYFFSIEFLNLFYAITLWVLRVKWLLNFLTFSRNFYYCRPV